MDSSAPVLQTRENRPPSAALNLLAIGLALIGLAGAYTAFQQFRWLVPALTQTANPPPASVAADGLPGPTLLFLLFTAQRVLIPALCLIASMAIWLRRWYMLGVSTCIAVCTANTIGPLLGVFGLVLLLQPRYRACFSGSSAIIGSNLWQESPATTAKILTAAFLASTGYLLVVEIPNLVRYLHTQIQLAPPSATWENLGRALLSPDGSLESFLLQVWLPAILIPFALAAALLLHLRRYRRLLMTASFLHAAAFPLGTITSLITLLWLQDPNSRSLFPPDLDKESRPDADPLQSPAEATRFRRSTGMR